jgi:hypothetical protein
MMRRRMGSRLGSPASVFELLLVMAALATVAFLPRPHHRLAFFAACGAGMSILGALVVRLTHPRERRATAGTREFESHDAAEAGLSAWKRWLAFSRQVVDYEFRILLVACYLLLVGPMAIAFRSRRDEAQIDPESTWIPRTSVADLDSARRPF